MPEICQFLFWFESINDELMATVLLFEEIGANNRRQLMPGPRLRLHGTGGGSFRSAAACVGPGFI